MLKIPGFYKLSSSSQRNNPSHSKVRFIIQIHIDAQRTLIVYTGKIVACFPYNAMQCIQSIKMGEGSGWMGDTPETVLTTRAPAVPIILLMWP